MKLPICLTACCLILLLPFSLFAKCPISANGTLKLYAPAGNLQVETTGNDSVEVEVSNRQVNVEETCGTNTVDIKAERTPLNTGIPDWKIRAPRSVTLDLTTEGGNIQVPDTNAEVRLRTSGGKVTTGNIKGNALIRGTEVRTGNIGGSLEWRGLGGRLQVGDGNGNAEFYTAGGDVSAGLIRGSVKAELGSGSINIRETTGDVVVSTQAGDISSDYVHGAFDGTTKSGNIRVLRVGSWVHAVTGVGDIVFHLVPEKMGGDLHIKAIAAAGDITMYLPEKMKATIDAVIEKPALNAKKIFSDFPGAAIKAPANAFRSIIPGGPEQQSITINGGGNNINVRTSNGTIKILKGN